MPSFACNDCAESDPFPFFDAPIASPVPVRIIVLTDQMPLHYAVFTGKGFSLLINIGL